MKRTYQTSQNLSSEQADRALRELKLGYLNLSEEFFPQAEINFKLALQYDENCADAFWGLMLCKLKLKSEDELYSNPVPNKEATSMAECQRALECADENLKRKYQDLLERIDKINEGDNY